MIIEANESSEDTTGADPGGIPSRYETRTGDTMSTHAGAVLALELQSREWTEAQFAEILDRPVQMVSEIITGKKRITRPTAAQIEAALGTPAEMWLRLQNEHGLALLAQDPTVQQKLDLIRLRAHLAGMRNRPTRGAGSTSPTSPITGQLPAPPKTETET